MTPRLWLPSRIASQIAILVIGAVVLLQVLMAGALFLLAPRPHRGPPELAPAATVLRLAAAAPAGLRPQILDAANVAEPSFRFMRASGKPPAVTEKEAHPVVQGLGQRLGPGFRIWTPAGAASHSGKDAGKSSGGLPGALMVALPDGQVLQVVLANGLPGGPPPTPVPLFVVGTLALVTVNIGVLTIWASRGITAPLARFAKVAEEFSVDRDPAPLPEEGPAEIRAAVRALNRMRDRIHSMFADRTQMLAAVSHDLRTPITRLRLRAEFIEEPGVKAQFARDLSQMDAMVQGALFFLRDGDQKEPVTPVDLSSLLQTIADAFDDMGRDVGYEGPRQAVVQGHARQLERAVVNLVENAVRYGEAVAIRLRQDGAKLVIDVADDGHGIAAGDRQRLLKPFTRGDAARGQGDAEGFGLGLSIAQSIAAAHGGELTLHDNQPKGLLARITLPAAGAAA